MSSAFIFRNAGINTPLIDYTYQLENSYRIVTGQIPYKDFFLVLTPGIYYINAFFLLLFHNSNLGMIALTILLECAGIVLSSIILLKICSSMMLQYLGLAVIAFSGSILYPFPSYNTSCFDMMLLFLAFYMWNHEKMTKLKWFWAGIMVTWPYIFKQNYGLFFAFAVYFFILMFLLKKQQFKECIWMLLGSAASATLFILFLTANGISIYDYIYQTLLFPSESKHTLTTVFQLFKKIFNDKLFITMLLVLFSALFLKLYPMKKKIKICGLFFLYLTLYFSLFYEYSYSNSSNMRVIIWQLLYFALIFIWLVDVFFTRKFFSTESIAILSFFIMMLGIFTKRMDGPSWLLMFITVYFYARLKKEGLSAIVIMLLTLYIIDSIHSGMFLSYTWIYEDSSMEKEVETDINSKFYMLGTKGPWLKELKSISDYIEKNIGDKSFVEIPGEDPIYWATETIPSLNFFQLYPETCPYNVDDVLDIVLQNNIAYIIVKEKCQYNNYIVNDSNISEVEEQLEKLGYIRADELGVYAIYVNTRL